MEQIWRCKLSYLHWNQCSPDSLYLSWACFSMWVGIFRELGVSLHDTASRNKVSSFAPKSFAKSNHTRFSLYFLSARTIIYTRGGQLRTAKGVLSYWRPERGGWGGSADPASSPPSQLFTLPSVAGGKWRGQLGDANQFCPSLGPSALHLPQAGFPRKLAQDYHRQVVLGEVDGMEPQAGRKQHLGVGWVGRAESTPLLAQEPCTSIGWAALWAKWQLSVWGWWDWPHAPRPRLPMSGLSKARQNHMVGRIWLCSLYFSHPWSIL